MLSELANRPIGLNYGNGTSYTALQMLEGFLPRDVIRTVAATTATAVRYRQFLAGEFDAVCLQEPWITVAEQAGCRLLATANLRSFVRSQALRTVTERHGERQSIEPI